MAMLSLIVTHQGQWFRSGIEESWFFIVFFQKIWEKNINPMIS